MNIKPSFDSYSDISDWIEKHLSDEKFEGDSRRQNQICLALCSIVQFELSPEQAAALDAARARLAGEGSAVQQQVHLDRIGAAIRQHRGEPLDRGEVLNRLIFGSLTSTDGLSWDTANYLLIFCRALGLIPQAVGDIFIRYVE